MTLPHPPKSAAVAEAAVTGAVIAAAWLVAVAGFATRPNVWITIPGSGREWPYGAWLTAAGVFVGTSLVRRRAKSAGRAFWGCLLVGPCIALAIALLKDATFASEWARNVTDMGDYPIGEEFWGQQLGKSELLFALAAAHGLLLFVFFRIRARDAVEWPDRALGAAGVWSLLFGLSGATHALLVDDWLGSEMFSEATGTYTSHGMWTGTRITSLVFGALVALFGAATALGAARRSARRRGWLARVRKGEEPGWLVRPAEIGDERALPSLLEGGAGGEVLVATPAAGAAYREGAKGVARV